MFKITRTSHSSTLLFFALVFTCLFIFPLFNAKANDEAYLKAGVSAIASKQYAQAIDHLSKALGSGGLSPEDTAKAYYYRGVAYNGKNEPARSIADFSNALFFKKNPPDLKSKILIARARAYKAVGLVARAENDIRASGTGGTTISSVSSVSNNRPVNTQRRQVPQQQATGSSSGSFARQERRNKPAVTQGWGASVSSNPVRQQQPARIVRQERQQPVARQARSTSSDGNYRSLFDSNARKVESRPIQRQARYQPESRPQQKTEQRRSFNTSAGAGSGRYRLQLAAVSSENDARAAWSKLVAEHSSLLSNQSPDFQTVNLGGSKSVVRIQIGPFSDKLSTLQLCNTFKQQGLDCFLVVR
ncbi:MAG: SPOR domain-containing protein [Methyloligellaceae bacterium]